jgi:hypothetical protein
MSPIDWERQRLDRRIALRLFACAFIFFALFMHGVFSGSDEIGVFEATRSLYERGELVVPPGHHVFESPRDQRLYNHFAIGQSLWERRRRSCCPRAGRAPWQDPESVDTHTSGVGP